MLDFLSIHIHNVYAIVFYVIILILYVIITIVKEQKKLYHKDILAQAKIKIDKILNRHGDD